MKFISIKGAKEHNLKNIDVEIPKNKLVVITGLSGCGKSSLAFDTIYVEGQRKYMESLPSYVRQFLHIYDKPDFESIEGISPTVAINQKNSGKNPRSIVATSTEIYDYLRVLFARIGVPHSLKTGKAIRKYSPNQVAKQILKLQENTKFYVMAKFCSRSPEELIKNGYNRFKIGERVYDSNECNVINEFLTSGYKFYYVIIDRLIKKDGIEKRLVSSIENALKIGEGQVFIEILSSKLEILNFSTKLICQESGYIFEEVEPRMFSFNSSSGWCCCCKGIGLEKTLNTNFIFGNSEGASFYKQLDEFLIQYKLDKSILYLIKALSDKYNIELSKQWNSLSDKEKEILLNGSNRDDGLVRIISDSLYCEYNYDLVKRLFFYKKCGKCNGYRLKDELLLFKIDNNHIGQVTDMSVEEALVWFKNLNHLLDAQEIAIADILLKEIISRLTFLRDVGLEYLTLNRQSSTLSGGEAQRIKLASQIGSGLTGVIYVLDEPSIGLHQCDNEKLIAKLKHLRDLDNTVIVVEHDEDTMKSSDYLIDMGPAAGQNGGEIIACGTYEQVKNDSKSITGMYLSGRKRIKTPENRRKAENYLKISGMNIHNLKNLEVSFPLQNFICVTGVSGSGKSSLVNLTLAEAVKATIENKKSADQNLFSSIEGADHLDKVIAIDQSAIGRAPFSNPITYVGIFDLIRAWYASLEESKIRGYKVGRFSFNVIGGRCENCRGYGMIKIDMHIIADTYVKCEECNGKRYNKETLEIKYRGKNISDVLNMTIDELTMFFEKIPNINSKLKVLQEVGLGYMQSGQPSLYLSGGEAQRIKLAKELMKRSTTKTLYTFDEPTTGLHLEDINNLLKILHKLVELGNTVVVIEHNLHFIKTADYIIDIGPKGGKGGGYIIASGTPEEVVLNKNSITGKYLKDVMN